MVWFHLEGPPAARPAPSKRRERESPRPRADRQLALCLLSAAEAQVQSVSVERDEDLEIALPGRQLYVQVKTRAGSLAPADVSDTIKRFSDIRSVWGV